MAGLISEEEVGEFGQLLIQKEFITENQFNYAVSNYKKNSVSFEEVLIQLNYLTSEQLTKACALFLDIPYICLTGITIDRSVLSMVDTEAAREYMIMPIGRKADGTLRVAVTDWNNEIRDIAAEIAMINRVRIAPALATYENVKSLVEQYYGERVPVGAVAGGNLMSNNNAGDGGIPPRPNQPYNNPQNNPRPASGVPALVPPGQTAPARFATPGAVSNKRASDVLSGNLVGGRSGIVTGDGIEEANVDQPIVIQFVNRILADAINRGASDIHFEPRRDRLDIRYRIDGTLHSVDSIRREFQSACTSRVKIMADMNIAEHRVPQDGRINVTIDGRIVDMRVSSLPTQYGESIVLRILDKGATRPNLDQLGFSEDNLKIINRLIRKPHGIFLATGPTGSGKTTTLYAAIQAIHTPEVNIITVEDPIEYDLEGIRQSNVHEKAGLTMAKQLRAILRQDPDIIYVGEIRDSETAEIAFRAALTGHLVFSTLHCNDAAGAVTRLLNMDVDPFLVASSVIGVLAQRLVRKVCPKCSQPVRPDPADLTSFGLDPNSPAVMGGKFLVGSGCDFCDYSGYKGRYSVQELMVMDDHLRNLVLQRTPSNKIRKAAIARGMCCMRQDAANKILQGITTFDEAGKRVFIEDTDDTPAHVY